MTLNVVRWFAVAGLAMTFTACNQNEFTGVSHKVVGATQPATPGKPVVPAPPPVTPGQPTPPSPPSPPSPSPPAVPGTPPAVPETPTVPQNPGIGTGTDTASGSHISIFDIIGGLIKILQNVQVDQPNQNDVIFGGTKTFHIGDGAFDQSSECASQVDNYALKGTRYFFEFEVLQDATTVTATIGKICGVDYNESNSIYLQSGSDNLDQKPLTKGQTTAEFTPKTLNVGKYTIVVESREAGAENANQATDHDDFIVGQVKVHADKPIKPGQVGARP